MSVINKHMAHTCIDLVPTHNYICGEFYVKLTILCYMYKCQIYYFTCFGGEMKKKNY